jgi:hypothetical protein
MYLQTFKSKKIVFTIPIDEKETDFTLFAKLTQWHDKISGVWLGRAYPHFGDDTSTYLLKTMRRLQRDSGSDIIKIKFPHGTVIFPILFRKY